MRLAPVPAPRATRVIGSISHDVDANNLFFSSSRAGKSVTTISGTTCYNADGPHECGLKYSGTRHAVTSVHTLGEHAQNTGIYSALASFYNILRRDVAQNIHAVGEHAQNRVFLRPCTTCGSRLSEFWNKKHCLWRSSLWRTCPKHLHVQRFASLHPILRKDVLMLREQDMLSQAYAFREHGTKRLDCFVRAIDFWEAHVGFFYVHLGFLALLTLLYTRATHSMRPHPIFLQSGRPKIVKQVVQHAPGPCQISGFRIS